MSTSQFNEADALYCAVDCLIDNQVAVPIIGPGIQSKLKKEIASCE